MARRRCVCLFGLSADPPTGESGHVGIVRALSSQPDFDEIRVVPVFRHTFSSKQNRLETFEHRLKMCQLAFGDIPKVQVSNAERASWLHATRGLTDEEKQMTSVGTASLIDYLLQVPGETENDFLFVLGADAFCDLVAGKWKESERVLRLLHNRLIVLHRGGQSEGLSAALQQTPGSRVIKLDHLDDVSSSRVRETRDESQLRQMVAPQVFQYIKQYRLYAFGEETQS